MSQKLYFRNVDDTHCYTLEKHLQDAKEEGLETIELYEAIPDKTINDFFFCKHFGEVTEKDGSCGKPCYAYSPRNGKSGICKHHSFLRSWSDEKKRFKVV